MSIRFTTRSFSAALLLCSLLLGACSRESASAPTAVPASNSAALSVTAPWLRTTPPDVSTGAAYAQLHNDSDQVIRITAISTPLADMTMLHNMSQSDGMMQMRDVDVLEIPAHGVVTLAPGGMHVMLMGLHQPLKTGDSAAISFTVEGGQAVVVQFPVRDTAP